MVSPNSIKSGSKFIVSRLLISTLSVFVIPALLNISIPSSLISIPITSFATSIIFLCRRLPSSSFSLVLGQSVAPIWRTFFHVQSFMRKISLSQRKFRLYRYIFVCALRMLIIYFIYDIEWAILRLGIDATDILPDESEYHELESPDHHDGNYHCGPSLDNNIRVIYLNPYSINGIEYREERYTES